MPVRIKDSVIVTGSKQIHNDYYIDYFKKKGKDIKSFLINKLGRNIRYHCDGVSENTITLAAKAVDKLLKKQDICGEDIDMIIFCSQYPEFTVPSQACMIHNHIEGKKNCFTLDINSNCLGMLRGLDVVNRYFNDKSGKLTKALLIGSDYMSIHCKDTDVVTYSSLSDGACAILLEYTDEYECGVIGSSNRTVSQEVYGCLYPECGMSSIENYFGNSIKTSWSNPDLKSIINAMKEALDDVLVKHQISVKDIDWYCCSQFSLELFKGSYKACAIPKEKAIYVGDKYGYTGTSSPFFAYTDAVESGKIKKGNIVLFSSVGIGHSICSMLVRV